MPPLEKQPPRCTRWRYCRCSRRRSCRPWTAAPWTQAPALMATKRTVQAIDRVMGFMVVLQRHLWLVLADLKDPDRKSLLNTSISPSGLFGDVIKSVSECFAEAQKHAKAMSHVLPHRSSQPSRPRSSSSHLPGRGSLQAPFRVGGEAIAVGGLAPALHQGNAYSRLFKLRSGHALEDRSFPRGMETSPRISADDLGSLR